MFLSLYVSRHGASLFPVIGLGLLIIWCNIYFDEQSDTSCPKTGCSLEFSHSKQGELVYNNAWKHMNISIVIIFVNGPDKAL